MYCLLRADVYLLQYCLAKGRIYFMVSSLFNNKVCYRASNMLSSLSQWQTHILFPQQQLYQMKSK